MLSPADRATLRPGSGQSSSAGWTSMDMVMKNSSAGRPTIAVTATRGHQERRRYILLAPSCCGPGHSSLLPAAGKPAQASPGDEPGHAFDVLRLRERVERAQRVQPVAGP